MIDGDLIPTSITDGLAAGVGADVPLLIGSTAHEFDLSCGGAPSDVFAGGTAEVLARQGLPEHLHEGLLEQVPGADARRAAGHVTTVAVYRRHVGRWAGLRAEGAAAPRTWTYHFGWTSAVDGIAGHCLDLPFGFDVLREPTAVRRTGPNAPQHVADAVHADWLAMIQHGAVDAPVHADHDATIAYEAQGRSVRGGYAFERAVAAATV